MKGSFLKIILTVCLCAISLNGYSQDRYKKHFQHRETGRVVSHLRRDGQAGENDVCPLNGRANGLRI
jgi:hypothetical protein